MCLPTSSRNAPATVGLILLCMTFLAACAPTQLGEGAQWVSSRHGVHDAHLQMVEGYPSLRLSDSLVVRLDHALASDDAEVMRTQGQSVLTQAAALAHASTNHELDQLDDAGWAEMKKRYFADQPHATSEQMRRAVHASMTQQVKHLERDLAYAPDIKAVHDVLAEVRKHVEPAVKHEGRVARALPWALATIPSALVVADIHQDEWHGSNDADFTAARRYLPGEPTDQDLADWSYATPIEVALLHRYAPVIYQELNNDAAYGQDVDKFGVVVAQDRERIAIDTTRPAVYAYAREVCVQGQMLHQLVYTHWYPEHPKLKSFDPEAGHLEGVTFRVTLDGDDEALLYETVYNCGCYHRVFVPEHVEAAAAQAFGSPEEGKQFAVERSVPNRIDMIVPELVDDGFGADGMGKPVIRCRAGWHAIVDVALEEDSRTHEVQEEATYTLLPYERLEDLPTPDGGHTSMFYDNGLVRGAQRLEGIFFTPIGILSAGQPRQRGTQLIHWDQWDFDDPHLFDKTLRLPPLPRSDLAAQPGKPAPSRPDSQAITERRPLPAL